MPPLPAGKKKTSAAASIVTTSQLAEEVPDAPLSLQDIKQASDNLSMQQFLLIQQQSHGLLPNSSWLGLIVGGYPVVERAQKQPSKAGY